MAHRFVFVQKKKCDFKLLTVTVDNSSLVGGGQNSLSNVEKNFVLAPRVQFAVKS